jgi:hypothetical protein
MSKHVYPVEGRYLVDVPAVEHDCDHKDCVKSGAFTEDPPPKAAKPKSGPATAGPSDSKTEE